MEKARRSRPTAIGDLVHTFPSLEGQDCPSPKPLGTLMPSLNSSLIPTDPPPVSDANKFVVRTARCDFEMGLRCVSRVFFDLRTMCCIALFHLFETPPNDGVILATGIDRRSTQPAG